MRRRSYEIVMQCCNVRLFEIHEFNYVINHVINNVINNVIKLFDKKNLHTIISTKPPSGFITADGILESSGITLVNMPEWQCRKTFIGTGDFKLV